MKKLGKALGAVAIAGAVAAGGAAFTNSNTQPATSVAGYGTTTVSGVTASSISYTLNTTGTLITKVNLVLTGDTQNNNIGFAFGTDTLTPCSDAGTFTPGSPGSTAYSCTASQDVVAATTLHVSAYNKP